MGTDRIDPITLSTVWHAFQSICKGMRHGHYIFGHDPGTNERYVVTTFDMDGETGPGFGRREAGN